MPLAVRQKRAAFGGNTGTEFLLGMVILALALLGTALIIHNGLKA